MALSCIHTHVCVHVCIYVTKGSCVVWCLWTVWNCFFYGNMLHCRSAATALMMREEFHKLGRCRPERNDFFAMELGGNANSSSRQIYLTFPADSMFKEEDVSHYFR